MCSTCKAEVLVLGNMGAAGGYVSGTVRDVGEIRMLRLYASHITYTVFGGDC